MPFSTPFKYLNSGSGSRFYGIKKGPFRAEAESYVTHFGQNPVDTKYSEIVKNEAPAIRR